MRTLANRVRVRQTLAAAPKAVPKAAPKTVPKLALNLVLALSLLVLTLFTSAQLAAATGQPDPMPLPTRAGVTHKLQLPPVGARFDYQLGGPSSPAAGVKIVVRDRADPTAAQSYNICYINGFQTQPHERAFWRKRQSLLLKRNHKPVIDTAWGETLLDIRTAKKRNQLAKIMNRWIVGCKRAGFNAVEFDNLDSFLRSKKMIKSSQTRKYARLLVNHSHRQGLAVGQKNWAEFNGRRVGFDFAISESCGRYRECARYTRNYGRHVLAVEYRKQDLSWTCKNFGTRISVVLRDVSLSPHGVRNWC